MRPPRDKEGRKKNNRSGPWEAWWPRKYGSWMVTTVNNSAVPIVQTCPTTLAHISAQRKTRRQDSPCQDSSQRQMTIQAQPKCEQKETCSFSNVGVIHGTIVIKSVARKVSKRFSIDCQKGFQSISCWRSKMLGLAKKYLLPAVGMGPILFGEFWHSQILTAIKATRLLKNIWNQFSNNSTFPKLIGNTSHSSISTHTRPMIQRPLVLSYVENSGIPRI